MNKISPAAQKISFGTKFQQGLDNAIGTFAPSVQLARMQSRAKVAQLHQYASADTGRSRNPPKSLRSPDSLGGQFDSLLMQRRAQDQGRDNAFIGHLANQYKIYALGDISYIPQTGDGVADQAYRDYWQEWMKVADAQGRFHFIDMMQLSLSGVVYNGRHGLIHHHNDDATFQLQPIMGYNIGNPRTVYTNPNNIQGIRLNPDGSINGYDLYKLTITGMVQFVQTVPASIFSCLNPVQSTDEYSAKTPLHAVLNDAHDMKVIENAWMDKIKWASFKTGVFNTPNGSAPETDPNANGLDTPVGLSVANGRVRHQLPGEELHGEEGFNVTMLENNTPSNNETDLLITKLMQISMALSLPLPFVWVMMGLPGTYTRLISEQAKRAFQHGPLGQKWLERTALNQIKTKVLISGIIRGVIPWTKNWDKGFFMYPAHPTVDVGRESKANLDENRQGIRSMATITAEEAMYWKDVDAQLGDEAENKIRIAVEKAKSLSAATGVPLLWTDVMPYLQSMSANPPPPTAFDPNAQDDQQGGNQLSKKKANTRLGKQMDDLSTKLDEWDESKHPRAEDGEFGNGAGKSDNQVAEDAKSLSFKNGGEVHSVSTGHGTAEFHHGSERANATPHIGQCYADNEDTANHYSSDNTFTGEVDVSGLKIAKVSDFNRDDSSYGAIGDRKEDIEKLQGAGIDMVTYHDEDPHGRIHTTFRIVSEKALARFKESISKKADEGEDDDDDDDDADSKELSKLSSLPQNGEWAGKKKGIHYSRNWNN